MDMPQRIIMMLFLISRTCILFKQPLRLLVSYIRNTPFLEKFVEFRNGNKIFLSTYPYDLTTIMVIFGKREYGNIIDKSIVIDIGANIGVFCIYAIVNGASQVVAFEPNTEAFKTLQKNIRENGFQNSITAVNLAVSSVDNNSVWIEQSSNPNNYTTIDHQSRDHAFEVKTISLKTILSLHKLTNVHLMKIDCEGAEYEIIEAGDYDSYDRINEIRFEYHNGTDRLTNHLSKYGFEMDKIFPDNKRVGRAFYRKN